MGELGIAAALAVNIISRIVQVTQQIGEHIVLSKTT